MSDRIYDSRAIANYLISRTPGGLDALQVMKLTYICHGFMLGSSGRPLIEDDVEAWKLGPVVRKVYGHLPGGPNPIVGRLPSYNHTTDLEDGEKAIVDSVLANYGQLSGLTLSSLTHRPGSPWERTWTTYGKNAVIPQALIASHYANILSEYKASREAGKTYAVTAL